MDPFLLITFRRAQTTETLTGSHDAGGGNRVGADSPGLDDEGGTTLGGVHPSDGPAALAAARVAALQGAAHVRVGVLYPRLTVFADRVVRGRGYASRPGRGGGGVEKARDRQVESCVRMTLSLSTLCGRFVRELSLLV